MSHQMTLKQVHPLRPQLEKMLVNLAHRKNLGAIKWVTTNLTMGNNRSEVLKLYRAMLRVTYKVEDVNQRKELQQWIRTDFDNNKKHKDEEAIRMMISKGKLSLRELEQAVTMAK